MEGKALCRTESDSVPCDVLCPTAAQSEALQLRDDVPCPRGSETVLIPLCALLFSLSFLRDPKHVLWTHAQCLLDTCGL